MASANVTLNNAKFYNVVKLDVVNGVDLVIDIVDDPGPLRWFFDNDPALDIEVDGNSAAVKAKAVGESEFRIFNSSNSQLVMTMFLNVIAAIVPEASSLNLSAGEPVPKDDRGKGGSSGKTPQTKPSLS